MTFYIDKQSGGFASTLIAFGWARIVSEIVNSLFGYGDQAIRLEDEGAYYAVTYPPELTRDAMAYTGHAIQPAPLIKTEDKSKKPSASVSDESDNAADEGAEDSASAPPKRAVKDKVVLPDDYRTEDYAKHKDRNGRFFDFKRENPDAPEDQWPDPPDVQWDTYRAINPAALPGYNNLLLDWHTATRAIQPEVLTLLFDLFSTVPNDVDGAWDAWVRLDKKYKLGIKPGAGALQLYNPDQGKGLNRSKIAGIAPGNVDNFWLLELLKVAGFYECAVTRLMQGTKDRKTYVLAPKSIDYRVHTAIMNEFRKSMQLSRPAVASDIMAIVLYTEAMITYAERPSDFQAMLFRKETTRPRDLVSGFHTAYYKDLGNAVATMNLAFMGLPEWITLGDTEALGRARDTLDELKRLTYSIDESRGEGYNLLLALRDFVSSGDRTRFFDFTTAYATYFTGRQERGKYSHWLSTRFVETAVLGGQEEPQEAQEI